MTAEFVATNRTRPGTRGTWFLDRDVRATLAADTAEVYEELGTLALLALPAALQRWTTDIDGFGGDHPLLTRATNTVRSERSHPSGGPGD